MPPDLRILLVDLLETFSRSDSTLNQVIRLERDLQTSPKRSGAATSSKRKRASRPPFAEEQKASLVADYQAGMSTAKLATAYDLGKGTVLKVLREAGVQVRWPRMTEQEIRQATRLYESGLSLVDVGKRLGRGYSTIHKALTRAGVPMRDPHERP